MPTGLLEKDARPFWERARLSAVLPVGLIVVVAIVCVMTAVLSSAHRADVFAVEQEHQLFKRALNDRRMQVLREAENVVTSNESVRRMWLDYDGAWVHARVGLRLKTFFEHDYVFVLDQTDRFVYALVGRESVDAASFGNALSELKPAIDDVRGRRPATALSEVEPNEIDANTGVNRPVRTARLQTFFGRPAIVAALGVVPNDDTLALPEGPSAMLLTVSLIDGKFLGDLSIRLKLPALRIVRDGALPRSDEQSIEVLDDEGSSIARFAWVPNKPGSQIVSKVLPFVAVAIAGFLVLAAFVLRYMRRASATIAASQDQLRRLAMHDPLSGLPNRMLFAERLEGLIREVRQNNSAAALLSIDLDHFKDVNDTLGHHVGDALIGAVAQRLCRTLRENDLVSRLGGDEFAVLTTNNTELPALEALADRIIATLSAPYVVSGHTLVIGASIGIVVINKSSRDAADIMRYADMALYRAKNEGRKRACIYDAAMDASLTQRKQLEHDLRGAIERGELAIAYQPLVTPDGQRMIGCEALCRWPHPIRGQVPPIEFIPVAEQSELIIPLGEWVLRRACLDAKAWPEALLAVNVSPIQFRRPDFVDVIERILQETGFDPQRLELEVTESTLLGNVEGATLAMRRLKAMGVKLALDDFGTGYSSLLYLRTFPFDKLKIDRSFVSNIESGADAAAIVHAIVSLGRGLGMKVTAEGVENAEQQLFLRAAGVHSMQGYHFGHPVEASEIAERLSQQPNPRRPAAARVSALAS
jgi:diguanylate cyclase (GGDEF)-like protein